MKIKKILLWYILIITLLIFVGGCAKNIGFETIAKGAGFNPDTKKGNYIIDSHDKLVKIWNETFSYRSPMPEIPSIDFSEYVVLAVFMGSHGSGGYGTEIKKVVEKDDIIEVFIKEKTPGKYEAVTEAFTSPFHIVKILRTNKEIIFKE